MTDVAPTSAPVLDVAGLRVAFNGTEILHGVSLEVQAGECVAVVGESGAGKSVLARSILGLAADGGSRARVHADRFVLAGRDAARLRPRDWAAARGRDVGLVLQDALASLDPLRTVGAEVAEALEVRGPGRRRVDRSTRNELVLRALTDVGLPEPALRMAQRPGELSGGMRQRALIASAIVTRPPLLVADEPTTALDATVAAGVLDLLAGLRDEGTAILLVSHDLAAVARVADRVLVLQDGRIVEAGPVRTVLRSPSDPYTRRLVAAVPRGPKPGPAPLSASPGPPVLQAAGLRREFPLPGGGRLAAVDGVDLELRRGETLGVVGESGSGKTTLARLLLAADAPDAGQVLLDGEPWSAVGEGARRARRARIRLVPQDPLGSFDPRADAGGILTEALRLARSRTPPAELLARVQLPAAVLGRRPRTLSGGQRQRLAIARALAADPQVLVCDEPVSALDVTVQAGILDLLLELQRSGLAMVFVSHDLAVVRRVSDRVLVMAAGRVVEQGPTEEVFARPRTAVTRALLAAATDRSTG